MDDVVSLGGARTAFGTYGGALRDVPVVDFTVVAAKAAIERAGIAPIDVDATIFGNVLYTSADSIYFSRHVALKSGCRTEAPALTVNRLCGSGFQAVVNGAQDILLGDARVCLVGGETHRSAPRPE